MIPCRKQSPLRKTVLNAWDSLTRFLTGAGRNSSRRASRARLAFENLEDRAVPTVAPYAVASVFDSAVYVFDANTGTVLSTLVAPNSQSTLSYPAGMTVGPDGNLYFSSQGNDSIAKYDVVSNTLTTFIASSVLSPIATANGDAAFAPAGLRFGPDGNLYVALNGGQGATSGGAVVRFGITDTAGQLSYNQTSSTIATGLVEPTEIAFGNGSKDQNNLYVSNSGAPYAPDYATTPHNVIKITNAVGAAPTSSIFIDTGTGGLQYPTGLVWGPDGDLYVVDLGATTLTGSVLRFSPSGIFDEVYSQPSTSLQYQFPSDAVFGPQGNLLTANLGLSQTSPFSGSISEFDTTGTFSRTLVSSSQFTHGVASTQLAIYVGNLAPTVSAGSAYSVAEGASLTLTATGSDPDSDTLTYSWDVNGDGTFGDVTGANPTLTWAQLQQLGITDGPASLNVRVMADDGHGHVVTSTAAALTVRNAAPTATLSVSSGTIYEGDAVTIGFSNPSDPSVPDTTAGFHYSFAQSAAALATSYAAAGTTATSNVSFAASGVYTVYGRIFDKDGGSTTTSSSVTISHRAPTLGGINITSAVQQGATATLAGTIHSTPAVGTLTLVVNWGDGTAPQTFTFSAAAASTPFSETHAFVRAGTLPVTLTLTDAASAHVTANAQIAVSTAPQNQLLTDKYFAKILDRDAGSGDIASWTSALSAGATPVQAAQGFIGSQEYQTTLAGSYYSNYLGRTGSASEIASWVSALQGGLTYEQMIIGFLSSPEFFAHSGGTTTGFVQGLYQALLGRSASSAEAGVWVQSIGRGLTNAQAVGGFLSSAEFATRQVDMLYQDYLGRSAASDLGSQGWVTQLQSAERQNAAASTPFSDGALMRLQLSFLASSEFVTVISDLSHTGYFVAE